MLLIDVAINLIYERMNIIAAQIPNAILHDAFRNSIILGCADRSQIDQPSKTRKSVKTFSIVPMSHFLIENCGAASSSIHKILPINQLVINRTFLQVASMIFVLCFILRNKLVLNH